MISGKPDFAEAAALSIDSLESGDYRERALELNSYINRYPLGMFNVAYLALQDVEGHAKYQSLYLDEESAESQLSRFSLLDQPDALAQVRALEGDAGLLLCANLYKQPAVAAVQKLYDPQGKVAGYLQMVYNQSYFQEISTRADGRLPGVPAKRPPAGVQQRGRRLCQSPGGERPAARGKPVAACRRAGVPPQHPRRGHHRLDAGGLSAHRRPDERGDGGPFGRTPCCWPSCWGCCCSCPCVWPAG